MYSYDILFPFQKELLLRHQKEARQRSHSCMEEHQWLPPSVTCGWSHVRFGLQGLEGVLVLERGSQQEAKIWGGVTENRRYSRKIIPHFSALLQHRFQGHSHWRHGPGPLLPLLWLQRPRARGLSGRSLARREKESKITAGWAQRPKSYYRRLNMIASYSNFFQGDWVALNFHQILN